MRICIIDDNALLADALAFGLGDRGHEVSLAGDGMQGLETVARVCPDAVVIDWRMPGMRGDAVAQQVRAIKPDVAIIMMSGGSAVEDLTAMRAYEGVADHFIEKPFTPSQLLSVIDAVFAKKAVAK